MESFFVCDVDADDDGCLNGIPNGFSNRVRLKFLVPIREQNQEIRVFTVL